jgi:leucyl/phenylalanyl-tRNA--protein transferase
LAFHSDSLRVSSPVRPRDVQFRESAGALAERWLLGTAWALMPSRNAGLPNLARLCLREWLAPDHALPDPELALDRPPGLAGIAHDLSVDTLSRAYRRGLFPLAHVGPVKWWSPPRRSLLFYDELHIAKRLRRQMRQGRYTVTFDRDIVGVLKACAGTRAGRWHLTWITPKVMRAYADAFEAGLVHSFEVWNADGALAGGGYGVAVGGAFSTESQFSAEPNTSKIGFTVLNFHLAHWGFAFNDGKVMTPTTRDMGFRDVPRAEYLKRLAAAARLAGKPGRWSGEADMREIADWQPDARTP